MKQTIQNNTFVNKVFSDLHLSKYNSGYNSSQQDKLIDNFSAILFEDIMARLIMNMDEAALNEFSSLLENDVSEEEIMSFMEKRVSNADNAIQEAVKDFTKEVSMLNTAEEVH